MKVSPSAYKSKKGNKAARALQREKNALAFHPPPIWFTPRKKSNKTEGSSDDKSDKEYKELNLKNLGQKVSTKVRVLREPDAETWIAWQIDMEETFANIPLNDAEKKAQLIPQFLAGTIKEIWQRSYRDTVAFYGLEENKENGTADIILSKTLMACTREIMRCEQPARQQLNYMRHHLHTTGYTIREFAARLKKLNSYLPYFPLKKGRTGIQKKLDTDELVDILIRAKPQEMSIAMMRANIDPYGMEWDDIVDYLERLETSMALEKRDKNHSDGHDSSGNENRKKRKRGKKDSADGKNGKKSSRYCTHCKNKTHNTEDCWFKDGNSKGKGKTDKSNTKKKPLGSKETTYTFTAEQISALMANLPSHKTSTPAKKKRKIEYESDSTSSSDASNPASHFMNLAHSKNKRKVVDKDDTSTSSSNSECAYMAFRSSSTSNSNKKQKMHHYSPEIVVEIIDRKGKLQPIRALVDTGTTSTLLLKQYVNKTSPKAYKSPQRTVWSTMGGKFETRQKRLVNFKFPEFSTDKTISWVVHVDERDNTENTLYDMIIGTDLMVALGLDTRFSDKRIVWEGIEVPMSTRNYLSDRETTHRVYHSAVQTTTLKHAEDRHNRILDADYTAVDMESYVEELKHLTHKEKQMLLTVLAKSKRLFKGGLGTLNIRPVRLELIKGATPYHARAYPVPKAYEAPTKKECDRLETIGVWERNHDSEWAAPTFVQPKKTGDIRVLTDFRKLNDAIRRKPFPLPKIADLLQKLEGFRYATAIDLSMGYYHIPLDEFSQALCTTVLPWGKYRYKRLPMGIKNAPDIFQHIMQDLLGDLDFVRVYIDDILITSSKDFADHLTKLDIVLQRLEKAGFRANVRKCFFAEAELEYLGFWVTREGIQPQPKKVEAIHRLTQPKTRKQLRRFLGMVNYYRDMWRRRSHILAPLTALSSKSIPWKWGAAEQAAFDEAKRVIAREAILAFPDFNEEFHIYTDASDYQLGAVIMQKDKPIAFYSRKLNSAQKRYTTGEQELLSIVETLKEFKNILLGQRITVHTDHKNLLYDKMSSDRIIRWRLLIEEFAPTFQHVAGEHNVVADALSRIDADFDMPISDGKPSRYEMALANVRKDDLSQYEFPLSPQVIAKHQGMDTKLQKERSGKRSNEYAIKTVENVDLIMHKEKICIPIALQDRVVAWYHEYLRHPGETRTEATIRQTMTWPGLTKQVKDYCSSCPQCQLGKKSRKSYGLLPAKNNADVIPWQRVNVDLIGPYTVKTPTGTHTLRAMTMIDPATRWFEVVAINTPSSEQCMEAFDNTWLCRYPRPQYIGYDNGSEFKSVFKAMCQNYGITPKPSSDYNPQSNSIIERVHLTLGNMLRTFELENQELNEHDPWTSFLSSAAWAIRSTYHTILDATPGQLVFGRDMILPITFRADWANIIQRKNEQIIRDNAKENSRRIEHIYHEGDKVILTKPGILPKMTTPREGPYTILKVHTNGTVRIQRGPVATRVNIRRLTPYRDRTDREANDMR